MTAEASTLSDEDRNQDRFAWRAATLRPIELDRLWNQADDEYLGSSDVILGERSKVLRSVWVALQGAQTDIKDQRPIDEWSHVFYVLGRHGQQRDTKLLGKYWTDSVHFIRFDEDNGESTAESEETLNRMKAYRKRIDELTRYGTEEGVSLRSESEVSFWEFIDSTSFKRNLDLVLLENGNLRVIWDDEHSNFLGIQFLGDHVVEYVIFRRRPASESVSRVAGIDTLTGIRRQIRAFGLTSLVNK